MLATKLCSKYTSSSFPWSVYTSAEHPRWVSAPVLTGNTPTPSRGPRVAVRWRKTQAFNSSIRLTQTDSTPTPPSKSSSRLGALVPHCALRNLKATSPREKAFPPSASGQCEHSPTPRPGQQSRLHVEIGRSQGEFHPPH